MCYKNNIIYHFWSINFLFSFYIYFKHVWIISIFVQVNKLLKDNLKYIDIDTINVNGLLRY